MMGTKRVVRGAALAVALLAGVVASANGASAAGGGAAGDDPASYWTAERRAAAQPRDLVLDHRGLGYLRRADGSLQAHGHSTPAQEAPLRATPMARPGGGGGGGGGGTTDVTGPAITAMNPAAGAVIGASYTFSAIVTDPSGVKSVTFQITKSGGTTQSFSATRTGGDTWSVGLQGFTDGNWSWQVVARDAVKKGNTTTSPSVSFTVSTGGGGGGGGIVIDSSWPRTGEVQRAAGRILFEMPTNPSLSTWAGYVCSGTAVVDSTTGRSVILTAAHCVYDDANKAFARNVLFIPDQDSSGSRTDRNCTNDLYGCWIPSFGVVDQDWASRTFPNNIPWDYGYYVVPDAPEAHDGNGADVALDSIGDLEISFSAPAVGTPADAIGYSYNQDPDLRYCSENLGTEGSANWWLPSCELSGGSSGGPWLQPAGTGAGPIFSVNSWGYTNSPGMAGPKLAGTSASCLFTAATGTGFDAVTNRGTIPGGC